MKIEESKHKHRKPMYCVYTESSMQIPYHETIEIPTVSSSSFECDDCKCGTVEWIQFNIWINGILCCYRKTTMYSTVAAKCMQRHPSFKFPQNHFNCTIRQTNQFHGIFKILTDPQTAHISPFKYSGFSILVFWNFQKMWLL